MALAESASLALPLEEKEVSSESSKKFFAALTGALAVALVVVVLVAALIAVTLVVVETLVVFGGGFAATVVFADCFGGFWGLSSSEEAEREALRKTAFLDLPTAAFAANDSTGFDFGGVDFSLILAAKLL